MIAIISDIHFGSKNFNKNVFDSHVNFFRNFFFPYLFDNNIKHVIIAGDLFHNRNTIDNYILQRLNTEFFDYFDENDITLYIIPGNHDLYYKNTRDYNSLRSFIDKKYKNIKIFDKEDYYIEIIDKYKIVFVPWILNENNYQNILSIKGDICIGHFEFINHYMQKNKISEYGYEDNLIKNNYKLIFSGHYHYNSVNDNLIYLGSPYQLTWNDYNDKKGFYILKSNFDYDFVENKISPKFIKIYYTELEDNIEIEIKGLEQNKIIKCDVNQAAEYVKNNYCKIICNNVINESIFETFFNRLNENNQLNSKIEVIYSNISLETIDDINTIKVEDEFNIENLVEQYLNILNIKSDNIFNLFKECYAIANERFREINHYQE